VIITIDGPAGTGKSTVAHRLAQRLGLEFLDTGAMYRAATLIAIERGIDASNGPALAAELRSTDLHFDWKQDPPRLLIGDRDVSRRVRDGDVAALVSMVASQPEVRHVLVAQQRRIADQHPRLVTEGRDQGSEVFPDAGVRFYLDARPEIRAARRAGQLSTEDRPADAQAVLAELLRRDQIDSTRSTGPLIKPQGAHEVDTSDLTLDEVVDKLEKIVRAVLADAEAFSSPPAGKRSSPASPPAVEARGPVIHRLALAIGRPITLTLLTLCYAFRRRGARRIPDRGPVIIVSNHQSYLDPIILGLLAWHRTFRPIARSNLFRFRPLAWLIRLYGAIPIEQGKGDRAAIKTAIDEVSCGMMLIVYPEGGRTRDGTTRLLQRGFLLVCRKTRAPIVPVAIEGAFDVWPPGRLLPRPWGRIVVEAGELIPFEEIERLSDDVVLSRLHEWMETTRLRLREELRRETGGRFPIERLGDRSAMHAG